MAKQHIRRDFSYEHIPTIMAFTLDDSFIREVMGPFGSAKSSGCLMDIVRRGHRQAPGPDGVRRTRWAIIRNTYPQLKDTTIKTVHDWLPIDLCGDWKATEHDYILNRWPGVEITLMFRALDRPDHVANLLSLELTGAWLNEVREIAKEVFENIQGRVGRYPSMRDGGATWFGVLMDTNPPDVDHWLYKLFEEIIPNLPEEQVNAKLFRQPSGFSKEAENVPNLPKNYYKNMAIGKDPEWVKVYCEGEYGYIQDGKPVHPNFRDSFHVAKEIIKPVKDLPIIISFDFGLTPACALSQLTPWGQLVTFREFVSEDMGIRRLLKEKVMPALLGEFYSWTKLATGDPSGAARMPTDESTCIQEVKNAGLKAFTQAPTNSLVARQNALDAFLTRILEGNRPGFLLSPDCRHIRKGLNGGYKFKKLQTGTEQYGLKPLKNIYSHICEALQYGAMMADGNIEKGLKSIRGHTNVAQPAPSALGWT
jgi:hypothetical protein